MKSNSAFKVKIPLNVRRFFLFSHPTPVENSTDFLSPQFQLIAILTRLILKALQFQLLGIPKTINFKAFQF